jgi:hypothetical protein
MKGGSGALVRELSRTMWQGQEVGGQRGPWLSCLRVDMFFRNCYCSNKIILIVSRIGLVRGGETPRPARFQRNCH